MPLFCNCIYFTAVFIYVYKDNIAEPKDFSFGNKNTIARININTTIQDYMYVEEALHSAISAPV